MASRANLPHRNQDVFKESRQVADQHQSKMDVFGGFTARHHFSTEDVFDGFRARHHVSTEDVFNGFRPIADAELLEAIGIPSDFMNEHKNKLRAAAAALDRVHETAVGESAWSEHRDSQQPGAVGRSCALAPVFKLPYAGFGFKHVSEKTKARVIKAIGLKKVHSLGRWHNHVVLCESREKPGDKVVVKFFPTNYTGFNLEVAALTRLQHTNVVSLLDSVIRPDSLSIVMRYCPHGSLAKCLGNLTSRGFIPLFIKLAKALYYIHTRQVIHGDIKPENILFDWGFEPQITDFDVSEILPPGESLVRGRRGTVGFSPPEMEIDEFGHHNGFKADAYALGAVLLCMLYQSDVVTGRQCSFISVLGAPFTDSPETPMIYRLVSNLMKPDPTLRWGVLDVLHELFNNRGLMDRLWGIGWLVIDPILLPVSPEYAGHGL